MASHAAAVHALSVPSARFAEVAPCKDQASPLPNQPVSARFQGDVAEVCSHPLNPFDDFFMDLFIKIRDHLHMIILQYGFLFFLSNLNRCTS